jgi:hypothetical protein
METWEYLLNLWRLRHLFVRVDKGIATPISPSERNVKLAGKRAYVTASPSPKNRT